MFSFQHLLSGAKFASVRVVGRLCDDNIIYCLFSGALRKLRRGDPFTERSTEWNPPTHGTRHKSFCTSKKQKVPYSVFDIIV